MAARFYSAVLLVAGVDGDDERVADQTAGMVPRDVVADWCRVALNGATSAARVFVQEWQLDSAGEMFPTGVTAGMCGGECALSWFGR